MTRPDAPGPRGILTRDAVTGHSLHLRRLAAAPLAPFVEHFWVIRWDLRGEAPVRGETLPHPSVHWVTSNGRSTINGVPRGRFSILLQGVGRAFGVKFRPGGFRPFLGRAVSGISGRELAPGSLLGAGARDIARTLLELDRQELAEMRRAPDGQGAVERPQDEQCMRLAEAFLLARLPEPDPRMEQVNATVYAIMREPEIHRAEEVAARAGMTLRSLQRLFREYVGVSPKWVIKRYRLHEAVERMLQGEEVNWSRLALELGYFDQAHFIKEWKALVGRSPGRFLKEKY